jgi:hypothetical protein
MDANRCKKTVYSNDPGDFGGHQCWRKAIKDGYCKVHHPDAAKARREKSAKAYQEKWDKSPQMLLVKANERIVELEAENKLLREQISGRSTP